MAKEKELLVEKKQIRNPKPLPPIKEEEIASHVPESCLVRRLGEASIAITKGTTPTTLGFAYQSSGVNFVKVENIVNGRIDRGGLSEFIVEDAHEALARPQLQLGDVLFSIAGTIGKTCIVRDEDLPANTNQALAIVRGTAIVFDSEYLQNVLDSAVAKWMHEKARGGAMKNVSLGDLTHLPIPIPPWLNNSGSSRRSPS
ncbi:MAG: restriction endonuclease subunit S [Deltaproteobacteria bacterium]|nr:restriction endonuclease subunit S [Deltaproteobacteria bacterium]